MTYPANVTASAFTASGVSYSLSMYVIATALPTVA